MSMPFEVPLRSDELQRDLVSKEIRAVVEEAAKSGGHLLRIHALAKRLHETYPAAGPVRSIADEIISKAAQAKLPILMDGSD